MNELIQNDTLYLPKGSLLVVAGASGAGKSTMLHRIMEDHQVVSADRFRGMLSGDEGDQSVTPQAWRLANQLIQDRLLLGQTTAVDSLALQERARRSLLEMAGKARTTAHFLMLWTPLDECLDGQLQRERQVPPAVVEKMVEQAHGLREDLLGGKLFQEGFQSVALIDRAQASRLSLG